MKIPKPVQGYKGKNWEVYNERCAQREKYAREQLEIILHNDEQWELFKDRMYGHRVTIVEEFDKYREKILNSDTKDEERKTYLDILEFSYVFTMVFICDNGCHYNIKTRKGERKFTQRKKFHCSIDNTVSDNGSTTVPGWLDPEKNICEKYYRKP